MVRDYHGYSQGYNVQAAATREQIIVAAEVTRAATDGDELHPMLEAVNRNLRSVGRRPMRVLLADANVRGVGEDGPELVIATRSNRNRRLDGAAPRGRIPAALSLRERMARKLATKRGRRLYEQRRWMIEPVFGDVKEHRGIRRFMRRGFAACASEWKLIAATHNLRKLYRQARGSGLPRPERRRSSRMMAPAVA